MIGNTELKISIKIQKNKVIGEESPITRAKTLTVTIFNI